MSVVSSVVMLVTLADAPALAEPEEEWEVPAAPRVDSIDVSEIPTSPRTAFGAEDSVVSGAPEVVWPEPEEARVRLPRSLAARGGVTAAGEPPAPRLAGRARAGSLPVRVGGAPVTPAVAAAIQAGVADAAPMVPDEVSVRVEDRHATGRAGVNGLLMGVARADGRRAPARVVVEIDYSDFRHAYGGDWASRLRVTALAQCGDRGPTGCTEAVPLATSNDYRAGVVAAEVPLSADGGFTMLAVSADPSGENGDYTATSLKPAATWQVSEQTGAFSWDYPLRMVPGVGGPEPNLSLSYSSQAVDGLTSNTNTQGSWIGDGWDMWPGYIERSYRSCADDTDAVGGQNPNNKDNETGDQCWFSDNASMSLNGRATELVKDGANRFRAVDDDGTRIERVTNTSLGNGTHNGEYWKATTVDGTQYFFGRHRRQAHPTDSAATNSTWTVPVFGNHPGEPCYQSGNFAGSRCTQGWRWNLDYIIDPHGNSMTLFYSRETGAYGREGDASKRTTYHRGGYLSEIEYGTRAGSEHTATVPARVLFDVADRCTPGATCNQSTPESWPDVPWDQYCASAPCTDQLAPTFWTQKRLDRIRAQVWRGSSFSTVESWQLQHEWLDAGDSDGEAIPMWFKGITRTGHVTQAGGSVVSDPQIVFDPGADPMANRVKAPEDGHSSLNRWRMRGIYTETGAYIGIGYSEQECNANNPPTPHTNSKRCYPQWYTPSQGYFEPELHWFHKYVVTQVSVHDTTGASPTQESHYDYLDSPAWRYADSELVPEDKRTWSQWRGYSKVRVVQGVVGETRSATEYLYLRGMHGDRAGPSGGTKSVQITDSQGTSVTDHEAHSGFLREETVRNGPGGAWVSGTINTPWRHGPTATAGPLKAYLTGTETARTRTNLGGGNTRWTRTTTSFDTTYGMPTQVDDRGDESTTTDDVCTRYEYARNTSTWMVDKVKRVETVGVRCSQTPQRPADVLSDQRTFFDNPNTHGATPTRGLPVRVQEVGSWSGSSPNLVTTERTTFDSHGRPVSVSDALNRTTTTAYTPATGGPVTATSATNPLGHTVTTVMERAWQLPTRTTDANGHVTDLDYDGLGRLTEVWLPGRARTVSGNPQSGNLQFQYLVRKNNPSAVTTRKLMPGNTYQTSITLFDGQLRERQTQTQAPAGGRVLEDTFHDSRGLVEWTSKGYFNSGNPSTTLVGTGGQPQIPGITRYMYDGAERVTAEIFLDRGQEAWRTSYTYSGDRTHVTPPAGGTPTTTILDARDRTVSLRQYHGATPAGAFDEATYTYTKRGELATVTDAVGNTWSYTYDQRGREIEVVDPDKGTTVTTYDAEGQETTVTDSRGAILGYTYDALGRRTSVRDGSPTGPKRSEWVYDTLSNGLGKLTRSIRFDGGQQYVSEVVSYDAAGRPTGTRVVVPTAETGLNGSYQTATTYRPDGSIATTTLPAMGGLPQERMVFSYNDVGAPTGMTSPWGLYTNSVTYNKLGELVQRVLGEHGKRLSLTYVIDEATGRLANTSAVPELKPELMDLAYSYDDAGNLLRIADSPGSSTPNDTQCFRYDHVRRLTNAWTPASGDCAPSPSVAGLGGPASYWHSWTYDQTGNRLSQVVHSAGGDTTTTYTHPAAGAPQPHAVVAAQVSGPGGSQLHTYAYDQAGNMTERVLVGQSQTLEYDSEANLVEVVEDNEVTSFVYDADGNRLIRRDADGKTLYLPGGQELRYDNATQSRVCTRYYTHIDTLIAVRTPSDLTWMVTDHHNTADAMVSSANLQVTRKRTTPFGETRGSAPGSWAGDKGFVGGTEDPTGLVHIGARFYDEVLGRFLSVDPVIDFFDPQQMHGYAYGNNAPPTFTDPDGLFAKKLWDKGKSAVNKVANAAETVGNAVASGAATAAKATANFAKETVNSIKEDPWKFAATVAVGVAVAVAVGAVCATGVGCAVLIGAAAGAAAAGAGYGIDVGRGDREFSVKDMATEMAIGGAIGAATGGLGAGAGALGRQAAGTIRSGSRRPVTRTPGCGRPNSFVPGTAVAMADGTYKAVEDVDLGDRVIATDPETGETSAEEVVATITGDGYKNLVEIRVVDNGSDEVVDAVTATDNHPIWVANRGPAGRWVEAGGLKPGDLLLAPDGASVRVQAIVAYGAIATVHNLTIAKHHTYYVAAGEQDILTHNTNSSCPLHPNGNGRDAYGNPCPTCRARTEQEVRSGLPPTFEETRQPVVPQALRGAVNSFDDGNPATMGLFLSIATVRLGQWLGPKIANAAKAVVDVVRRRGGGGPNLPV